MTRHLQDATQFFLTAPSPCPYLEGKEERKLFTHLPSRMAVGHRAAHLHQLLSAHGFRRSQNLVYRPSCEGCSACQSARVVCDEFKPKKRHRRLMRANADLKICLEPPIAEAEHYDLFMRYLNGRHRDGGMAQMSFADFEDMVEDTPVDTIVVEYRLPEPGDAENGAGRLVGVALSDVMDDGYSMVYSFFDPDLRSRGLGNFMVLEHIARAQKEHMAHVYLGYWVENSPKMHYKGDFRPLEIQVPHDGWQRLS
jgi:leucyl-tRNA---protein transferase